MTMAKEKDINFEIVDVDDLIQDNHNFNKGRDEGAALIGRSFAEHGAGRSVLIDKNNRLVGGNKAQKGFKGAGYHKVVIVDTEPDTLVAVRRKDVDLDSEEGRKMALLDNLTTQVNLTWDQTELQAVQADVPGFDIADFGFDIEDLPQTEFGGATATPPHTETERLSECKFVDCYYTPTEKPDITLKDCIDLDLFSKKMQVIKESNLSDEMKKVMQLLAYRFIKIDFENVANYYAFNASEEEKRIIERLRCVLVDGSLEGFFEDRMLRVHEHFDTPKKEQEEKEDD